MDVKAWFGRKKKLDPIAEFREDHRKIRDGILSIAEALEAKDVKKARGIFGDINITIGPHFRYEEEALYPALRKFLGGYVDQLPGERDGVIATARTAAGLLSKDSLTDEDFESARRASLDILIHVSTCEGFATLSERLESGALDSLGEKFLEVRKANVPFLEWVDTIRTKRQVDCRSGQCKR